MLDACQNALPAGAGLLAAATDWRVETASPAYRQGAVLTAGASWLIRRLRQDDLPLYRPVRLEALRSHPEAFASSLEEELGGSMARMIGEAPSATLGGFVADQLVGTVGLFVPPKIKRRHKGHVVAVYVAPPWRGTGLSQALLDRLIDEARENGLRQLTLSVTAGNAAAKRLYARAGFTVYGTEPAALRIGSEFHDEDLMVLGL